MKKSRHVSRVLLVLVVPILLLAGSFGTAQAHFGAPHLVTFESTSWPGFTIAVAGPRGIATVGLATPVVIDCAIVTSHATGQHTVYMHGTSPLGGEISLVLYAGFTTMTAKWGSTGSGLCNTGWGGSFERGHGIVVP